MTPVIFRKDRSTGEVTAVFPTLPEIAYTVRCYAHIGQHGSCNRAWYICTKPATPDEYAPLLRELVQIGYDDLVIRKRWQMVR